MNSKTAFLLSAIVLQPLTNAQEYYPLGISNRWYYHVNTLQLPADTGYVEVVGDTLFPNGEDYAVLSPPSFLSGQYVRADSDYVFYISPTDGSEQPLFHLRAQPGDTTYLTWGSVFFSILIQIDTSVIFGRTSRTLWYRLDGLAVQVVRLAELFGPLRFEDYGDGLQFPFETWDLIGCVIGDSTYGYVVSVNGDHPGPSGFRLENNYPNPFNSATVLSYQLTAASQVSLTIFDLLGRAVCSLVDEKKDPGYHMVRWDGRNGLGMPVPSGVYYYRLQAGGFIETRAMMLLR